MNGFRRKSLECGSCGDYFMTWPEYVDQDQDRGIGICADCQQLAEEYNDRILDDACDKMRAALRPDNQKKWDGFDKDFRRALVCKAIDDGVLTWTIGTNQ